MAQESVIDYLVSSLQCKKPIHHCLAIEKQFINMMPPGQQSDGICFCSFINHGLYRYIFYTDTNCLEYSTVSTLHIRMYFRVALTIRVLETLFLFGWL